MYGADRAVLGCPASQGKRDCRRAPLARLGEPVELRGMGKHRPVLAIGIDAAEATQVRRLVADGVLPNLGALGAEGAWFDLFAHADLGSAAGWPTFVTGTPPDVHGLYCDWLWDPERMA
ncbi:MAG: alkaline phosphatase family protein, partial [Actinobacteria bacterium]